MIYNNYSIKGQEGSCFHGNNELSLVCLIVVIQWMFSLHEVLIKPYSITQIFLFYGNFGAIFDVVFVLVNYADIQKNPEPQG